jgi:hypothetical protein
MKPVIYVLELCDTTGEHRPVAVMHASTPFPPVSVGDRFDDEGWTRIEACDPPGSREQPRRYIVHSVKHVLIEESERFVARYCLNLTPHGGPRSPVWGDSEPVDARPIFA